MNRTLVALLALAFVLATSPSVAHAQVPGVNAGNLVATQPVTDDGTSSTTTSGLRAFLADLRQFKTWFSAVNAPAAGRTPKAASRSRRAAAGRSQVWVP